jgi:hypothetical protein
MRSTSNPFSQLDLVGMRIEDALHCVAKIERAAPRFRTHVIYRHPKRKERRIQAAFPQPRQIHSDVLGV